MTAPIPTAFLVHFFLKEQITKYDILSMVFAFGGVVMINDPFNAVEDPKKQSNYFVGTIYAIFASFFAACAGLCMRYMRDGIHASISPFWFAAGGTFYSPLAFILIPSPSPDGGMSKDEY